MGDFSLSTSKLKNSIYDLDKFSLFLSRLAIFLLSPKYFAHHATFSYSCDQTLELFNKFSVRDG